MSTEPNFNHKPLAWQSALEQLAAACVEHVPRQVAPFKRMFQKAAKDLRDLPSLTSPGRN